MYNTSELETAKSMGKQRLDSAKQRAQEARSKKKSVGGLSF
jgi:hypothetical protein